MKKKIFIGSIIFLALLSIVLTFTLKPGNGKRANVGSDDKQIAIINVSGTIVSGSGEGGVLDSGGAGSQTIIDQINEIKDNEDIKGVIIRIDSPGGSAAASQEIGEAILELKNKGKIVYTSMGDVAASGGYWIAAVTDKIYANPATMTGSIGVIMQVQNWSELYKKVGIVNDPIKSGKHKDMGSQARALDPEEKKLLQSMVMDIYNQFVDIIVKGRKLPRAEVLKIADGRVLTGNQAKKLKLVDELGSQEKVIKDLAKTLKIEGEPELYEFETAPFAKLLGLGAAASSSPVTAGLTPEEYKVLKQLLQTYK
jgi:protease IV